MAKIEMRYVQAYRDRHGKQRCYFRRDGQIRVRLPGLPGSAEFMAAYEAAMGGETAPKRQIGAERTRAGSFSALLVAYYASTEWSGLKEPTRKVYKNTLERFRAAHGDKLVAGLQAHHIRAILDKLKDTPGAAGNLRKRLRQLMQFAVERNWRADNPCLSVRRPRAAGKGEGFIPWSEGDIGAYEARWPEGSRERLALALLLYTGQRRSDVVRMGRQHLRGTRIAVRQIKTDAQLLIPVHPRLKAAIDATGADNLTFMMTEQGAPFSAAGFTNWFVDRAKMAGLSGRTPHGLRKAAARRLAEAGCSAKQIAAITGHKSLSEVADYTASAEQSLLADQAMEMLARAEG